jgi:hypothetical protein
MSIIDETAPLGAWNNPLVIGSRASELREAHVDAAKFGCVVCLFRTATGWDHDTIERVPLASQRDPDARFVFAGLTLMREE